ncbi:MAG: hypothetical protein Q9187_004691 [Circinaria calcarea]
MADFGAAAGAVGVISLGIQVCQGLVSYCNAWKSHDKDMGDASEKLGGLRLTLETLQDIMPKIGVSDPSALSVLQTVYRQISSSNNGLGKLQAALTKFETLGTPASFRESLRNFKQQSLYPFRKDVLKELRSAVTDLQANLDSAVQVLVLYNQVKQGSTLASIETATVNTTTKVEELQAKLEAINCKLDQPSGIEMQVSQSTVSLEAAIVGRLEQYGRQMDQVQNQIQLGASQHSIDFQQLNQSMVNLQLGLVQSPGLLHSTIEEKHQRESSIVGSSRARQRGCLCRTQSNYGSLRKAQRYRWDDRSTKNSWNANLHSSLRIHRRDCPLYDEIESERLVGMSISYCGTLLMGAIRASISMTRGAGGFSISPSLTFSPVVPSTAPAFALLNIRFTRDTTVNDMQQTYNIRLQQLSRLYSERKASPHDTDQDGNTVLHFFRVPSNMAPYLWTWISLRPTLNFLKEFESWVFLLTEAMQKAGEDLDICTNKVGELTTSDRTCLSELVGQYSGYRNVIMWNSLLTKLNLKMVDLGAELPPLTTEFRQAVEYGTWVWLAPEFARFPDILEAVGCNEISQAVLTQSACLLKKAIECSPHLIDIPNLLGQTPLHLSIDWPEGIQILLNTSANVDAADWNGHTPVVYGFGRHLLEPIRLLTQADCCLHFPWPSRVSDYSTLLHYSMMDEFCHWYDCSPQALVKNSEATVDYVISLFRERRQRLGNLVKTSLPPSSIGRLDMSSDKLLDHKAHLAVAMLEDIEIPVPQSLLSMEPLGQTVYHIRYLNLRQARLLWEAGFRDVNALDSLGLSPLMHQAVERRKYPGEYHPNALGLLEFLQLLGWFLTNGANLHSLQRYAFRKVEIGTDRWQRGRWRREEIQRTDTTSSMTASHYIGNYLGDWIVTERENDIRKRLLSLDNGSSTLICDILGDTTRDACCCACSSGGCLAFTVMIKYPSTRLSIYYGPRKVSSRARKAWLDCLQYLAVILDIEEPQMSWLRSEMFRIITFERFQLKHTCCTLEYFHDNALRISTKVIVELDDEEDREEIRQEQEERVEKLEALIVEFEDKYQELGIPLGNFLNGYWRQRMREVMREEAAVDRAQLSRIGVVMDEDDYASSDASDESDEIVEEDG